jgi:hypothetical protein
MEFIKSKQSQSLHHDLFLLYSGVASICMDFGHFTLKRNSKLVNTGEESTTSSIPKVINHIIRLINNFISIEEY